MFSALMEPHLCPVLLFFMSRFYLFIISCCALHECICCSLCHELTAWCRFVEKLRRFVLREEMGGRSTVFASVDS